MLTLFNSLFVQYANAMYFYAEPDTWRCFQDTVVSNYVSAPQVLTDTYVSADA